MTATFPDRTDTGPPARLRRRLGEILAGYALVALPALFLFGLVLSPALYATLDTFVVRSPDGTTIGLDRYGAFFADAYSRANLLYTVNQTILSTVAAVGLSLMIAVYLRFGRGPLARFVQALAIFPLFVPGIIISYALIRFLGPNGSFQIVLEHLGIRGFRTPYLTPVGPFIGFVWTHLPLPVLVITAAFSQVSDHSIEAARDLGAGSFRIFAEILVPQATRAILIALSLTFLEIFGSFTIPYILGPAAPEMMGVFMQRTFGQLLAPGEAQVQAVVSFAVCLAVGVFYVRLIVAEKR